MNFRGTHWKNNTEAWSVLRLFIRHLR